MDSYDIWSWVWRKLILNVTLIKSTFHFLFILHCAVLFLLSFWLLNRFLPVLSSSKLRLSHNWLSQSLLCIFKTCRILSIKVSYTHSQILFWSFSQQECRMIEKLSSSKMCILCQFYVIHVSSLIMQSILWCSLLRSFNSQQDNK